MFIVALFGDWFKENLELKNSLPVFWAVLCGWITGYHIGKY
jgi:hypothetical protein